MEILPPGQPDGATHEAHGLRFVRSGSCGQCGACGCATEDDGAPCPHLTVHGPNYICEIYDTRADYCDVCGHDHQYCVDFPEHPWVEVIRTGTCDYHFMLCGTGAELAAAMAKLAEMNATWNWVIE